MRIHLPNRKHPANLAKSLRKALLRRDIDIALARCQQVVAAMFGYSGWHELSKVADEAVEPSLPDELCSANDRRDRRKQYCEAITSLGVSPTLAGEIVDDISPTGQRVAPDQDEFLMKTTTAERFGLPRFDWSPAVTAAHSSLAEFIRDCHKAVRLAPFWCERSLWEATGERNETAEGLLRPFVRDLAHPGWLPAIALTFCRTGETGRWRERLISEDKRKLRDAAARAFFHGPDAAASHLASLQKSDKLSLVSFIEERLGAVTVEAACLSRKLPADISFAEDAFDLPDMPKWRNPEPFAPTPFKSRTWSPVDLSELQLAFHELKIDHLDYNDQRKRFEIKRCDTTTDLAVQAFAATFGNDTLNVIEGFFSRASRPEGERFLLLVRDKASSSIVAGVALHRHMDRNAPSITFDLDGHWAAKGKHPVDLTTMLAAYVTMLMEHDIWNWETILPPGSVLTVKLRAQEPRGYDAEVDIANSNMHEVEGRFFKYALDRALQGLREIGEDESAPVAISISSADDQPNDFDRALPKVTILSPEERAPLAAIGKLRSETFKENRPFVVVPWGEGCRIFWGDEMLGRRGNKAQKAAAKQIEAMPFRKLMQPVSDAADMKDPVLLVGRYGRIYAVSSKDIGEFAPDDDFLVAVTILTEKQAAAIRHLPWQAREFWDMFNVECICVSTEGDQDDDEQDEDAA
ncbi:hypothetical protein ACVIGB_001091 [Bradyrhizobium sp. USDA 4341]